MSMRRPGQGPQSQKEDSRTSAPMVSPNPRRRATSPTPRAPDHEDLYGGAPAVRQRADGGCRDAGILTVQSARDEEGPRRVVSGVHGAEHQMHEGTGGVLSGTRTLSIGDSHDT